MAVRELGMKPKKFWRLSFYEWHLWSLRIEKLIEDRIDDKKFLVRIARRMMRINAEVMGAKNVKEAKLWPLPEDVEEKAGTEYTEEEFDAKVEAAIKARKKRKKKNG